MVNDQKLIDCFTDVVSKIRQQTIDQLTLEEEATFSICGNCQDVCFSQYECKKFTEFVGISDESFE